MDKQLGVGLSESRKPSENKSAGCHIEESNDPTLRPENDRDKNVKDPDLNDQVVKCHGPQEGDEPSGPLQQGSQSGSGRRSEGSSSDHVFSTTAGSHDPIRHVEAGNAISRGGTHRSRLLPMVSSKLGRFQEAGTCGIPLLPSPLHRKDGSDQSHRGGSADTTSRGPSQSGKAFHAQGESQDIAIDGELKAIEKEEEDLEERVMMHSRMDQMEHVLSQIVQQLQHLTVQSQSSAYPQPQ